MSPIALTPMLFALLLSYALVNVLTCIPRRIGLNLTFVFFCLFALAASLFTTLPDGKGLVTIVFTLMGLLAGWGLATQLLMVRPDPRKLPQLVRDPGAPGNGHIAVVYFAHGEPEEYNPICWINQFREFDQHKIRFIPFFLRPVFLFKLRQKYLHSGGSDHAGMHQKMIDLLEQSFRSQGDTTTHFYLSFLDDEPHPDAAVIQALNDGASRIVVAEVFLTVSNHTTEGEEQIKKLEVDKYGIPVDFTGPLWDSTTLMDVFVKRADASLDGTPREKVGILLVGHGQPDEWDQEFPTETEHENQFRHGICDRLVKAGYLQENIAMAWMEFKDPRPTAAVEIFHQKGLEKVLYFPTAISADAIHSVADIPELVGKAKVPASFPRLNMGAWNDDPQVIQAIKEKIDAVMP